ncbi:MAG: Taurine import ATP-binding protein TauB [Clostridium sp.]
MIQEQESKTKSVLSLSHVNFIYPGENGGVTALESINLDIPEGEFLCVLGPSGCGKTTLLKIMAGFLRPTSGQARMDGELIQGPDWHRGVIFQSPPLYPWLSVQDNIAFGLKMRKYPKSERNLLVEKYIDLVGLKGFENSKPYELSGGMKQRVSLARTLVNQPRILLMDEPFGALDALTRQNMQDLVRKIWKETGNTVLLITHDVDEALALATRTIVLSGRPGRILNEFHTSFTHRILKGEEQVEYLLEYRELKEKILQTIRCQHTAADNG